MCAPARTCNAASCDMWRYKEKADAQGETHCKCGRPFTSIIYKPLPKGGKGAKTGRAQGAPKAKAKAKPAPVEAEAEEEPEVRKAPAKVESVPAKKNKLADIVADWDDE